MEQRKGWLFWAGLGLLLVGLTVAGGLAWWKIRTVPLPVLGQVTDFRLTNQIGQVVTGSSLKDRVWVVDIIFTRCPGPCIELSREMARLQTALPPDAPVSLVSLTADPGFDSVGVLRRYADGFEASASRWHFLTGEKEEIYRLAIDDLMLAVGEIPPEERENLNDLFVHSTRFVLIDREGRIRGLYEGTDPTSHRLILRDIRSLLSG